MNSVVIRSPKNGADRVHWIKLCILSGVGFLAGWLCLRATLRSMPVASLSSAEIQAQKKKTSSSTHAISQGNRVERVYQPTAPAFIKQQNPETQTPENGASTSAATVRVQPGRIAYLRCVGENPPKSLPVCQRDLTLEETLWNALLQAIPERLRVTSPIEIDVRFLLVRDHLTWTYIGRAQNSAVKLDIKAQEEFLQHLRPAVVELRPKRYRELLIAQRLRIGPQ